ncbi:MAG: T9SS type A sorting domain-containing protein [Chlorobi bacterium]|nr:T9SS type A sorting domain-containing protein [Chlorobiota bacterium]
MNTKSIITLMLISLGINSQEFNPHSVSCFDSPPAYCYDASFLGGQCKPESIDRYTSDPLAVFRVLIVYAQFQNDPNPNYSHWMKGQPPEYFEKLLSPTKSSNPNWWDAYDEATARMSDYWMEVSRGKFHVIGQEVNIILDKESGQYTNGAEAMDELYDKLDDDPTIDWTLYDQWSKDGSGFRYGAPFDGYVDMIYFIWRSPGTVLGNSSASFTACSHSQGHVIYNQTREIKIYPDLNEFGSGFQISDGPRPLQQWSAVSFIPAEHGHYTLGVRVFAPEWDCGHQGYGKVNNYHGYEEFFSPYELIRHGWYQTKKVDYGVSSSYQLDDWTSRNNSPYLDPDEILEVPIGDASRNEFFLIVNRQKVSTYDKIMWGDTAHDDPYRKLEYGESPNYGKGVYIYHAYPGAVGSGYQWQVPFDQECADGLYNWVQDGYQHPDWSCTQDVEYYKRVEVVYNMNDNGGEHPTYCNGPGTTNIFNHDGKSLYNWFGLGDASACGSGADGTDRYWTNLIESAPWIYAHPAPYEVWTSRELKGDRWDAWKVGYNEVFSPYSSPSTVNWDNQNSGIFIYLESQISTIANFKIYKVGVNGTLEQILQWTPPAKPMNLKIEHCYQQQSYGYNKLTWNHNLEPDMRRDIGGTFFKRYNVYKVSSVNPTYIPDENNYSLLATVDIDENQTPSYVDVSEPSGCMSDPNAACPPICWILHAARYRVEAVDVHGTPSVKSDFASVFTFNTSSGGGTQEGDNPPSFNNTAPTEFTLLQNYPNPFNPATEIKYELPKNSFVTIKIYNALGEEIENVVNNEWKSTGRYSVLFDGTNFASGIYFYTIEAGNFKDTKKMILIK